MLELIALCGFLGGLARAGAGFLTYGRPPKRNIPPVLLITGLVGIVSVFAAFYLDMSLASLAYWKLAAVSALAGYVGSDLLSSLFTLLRKESGPRRKAC